MSNEGKKPNKRQMQYNKTLEAIRKAVDELVKEQGFENMRIVDVVGRVGIAEGTFYHYFKSKNELLRDRLYRSNRDITAYFDRELAELEEIDALKKFVLFLLDYAKSRVVEVHTCYLKAMLDNYEEWNLATEQMIDVLLRKLVADGQAKGRVSQAYGVDQIVDFIQCYFSGVVYNQCLSRGIFMEKTGSAALMLNWIEGLRA